jgi:hypothetical protein
VVDVSKCPDRAQRPRVELEQLLQVASELDDGATTPPCSEAEVVRDAAAEIERLRASIVAAIGEFDRGDPGSALTFLLNAAEGLP